MKKWQLAVLGLGGVGVLIGVGWWWWDDLDPAHEVARSVSCNGVWYDSHMHLDNDDFARKMAPLMLSHGVNCGVLFVQMNLADIDDSFELAREALGETPGVFVPFFDVIENKGTAVQLDQLTELSEQYGEFFRGFGEFALYQAGDPKYDLSGTDLLNATWSRLFTYAGQHNLIVMLHITPREAASFEQAAAAHPQTTFLIHGFELGGAGYAALLKRHPNVYYTLDTATLLKDAAPGSTRHLMYPGTGGNVREFIAAFDADHEYFVNQALREWAPVISAVPERVLWGTDVSSDWHSDPEVYDRLIQFSEQFVAGLPQSVRAPYQVQNALRLFGAAGVVYEPIADSDDEID